MARPVDAEPGPDPRAVAANLAAVRERIARALERAGRPPGAVQLLAVTKGHPFQAAAIARGLGLERLGENYVQEAEAKARALAAQGVAPVRWHLLGHCQRNKARRAADLFATVETVDSPELAQRLGAARAGAEPLPVLLEVELTGLPGRTGFTPRELEAAAAGLLQLPGLRIEGLMTVGAPGDPGAFPRCARLREALAERCGVPLPTLSMGMSDDLEPAIAAGSTRVRIGRALFGPRPAP